MVPTVMLGSKRTHFLFPNWFKILDVEGANMQHPPLPPTYYQEFSIHYQNKYIYNYTFPVWQLYKYYYLQLWIHLPVCRVPQHFKNHLRMIYLQSNSSSNKEQYRTAEN